MRTRTIRIVLPIAAVAALLLVVAWMAGVFRDKVEPGSGSATTGAPPAGSIEVSEVETALTEPVPATISARQATTISSRIIARITRIHVRAGDTVEEGQLLLELERSDLESRLSQAEERVRSVSARLTEARLSLERAESLQAQGLVSRAALDEARATHDSLNAELATARRTVDEAQVAISYTRIRSPIDGRVIDRFAEPGDTASPGTRLLSLYNPLSLRIEAAVRESLALPLVLGQEIEVEIPALQQRLTSRIEELVPAADPGSRSFLVKAQLPYRDDLLPGMYARLMIPAGTVQRILVPADFAVAYGQLNMVWVWTDGAAERRFVRLGQADGSGRVEVQSGLRPGEVLAPPPN
ncbi:efflux RND transporter periplasmic adaptor subunit [Elongatibacter sediminis]|uniref:Efflux RND transporter periplasmic adaptor subunit n=1 Tax=Elongatibacter sediminis TaxID=3119006 RepID=A0AAW9REQ3_9GAMM